MANKHSVFDMDQICQAAAELEVVRFQRFGGLQFLNFRVKEFTDRAIRPACLIAGAPGEQAQKL